MVRFAIIGYGNIGTRHAQLIIQNEACTLVSICDNKPEALQKAKLLNIEVYSDLDLMLRTENIDVVCVCTPNYLHAEHSISALTAGCHVLCEKPMCMSTSEADRMIDTALTHGKHIMVVKQNRYNPAVLWVKNLIDTDILGSIYTVSVRGYWNRNKKYYQQSDWRGDKQKDGGCLYTQYSHFVDILYHLLGEVEALTGSITNDMHPYINTEDSGTFVLKNTKGAMISFQYSTCAYSHNMEGSITLIAEKGCLTLGGKYMNEISYADIEGVSLPQLENSYKPNAYPSGYEGTMSNHHLVIQNVVDVLDQNASIKTSAEEGRDVVSIIEDMYRVAVD